MIQQKEEGGSSCDDRPLFSLCLICPLHHSATLHSYCAQECGQDRYDKSDYLRPSILVFHSFFTFLHFYIFTFLHSPQIFVCFLPRISRISRISRIFLSTARIANPTERQYPLNPCSFRFRFYFYHGFHESHGFFSASSVSSILI